MRHGHRSSEAHDTSNIPRDPCGATNDRIRTRGFAPSSPGSRGSPRTSDPSAWRGEHRAETGRRVRAETQSPAGPGSFAPRAPSESCRRRDTSCTSIHAQGRGGTWRNPLAPARAWSDGRPPPHDSRGREGLRGAGDETVAGPCAAAPLVPRCPARPGPRRLTARPQKPKRRSPSPRQRAPLQQGTVRRRFGRSCWLDGAR